MELLFIDVLFGVLEGWLLSTKTISGAILALRINIQFN